MRLLITGASGFLGFHLTRYLERKHKVRACYRSRPVTFSRAESQQLDFTDSQSCLRVLQDFLPTHIVHAGAMALTAECENKPMDAFTVNVAGTLNLLMSCQLIRPLPHFTLISTDLVFDGTKGDYTENDLAGPIMVYGRTKLEAERVCSAYLGPASVIRSSLIYGPLNAARPSFLDWMLQGIRNSQGRLFSDEFRTPVFVYDLIRLIEECCLRNAVGIFHAGGSERLSRYEFGLKVAEAFHINHEMVLPGLSAEITTGAPRPRDVSLNIDKARRELSYNPMDVLKALDLISGEAEDENQWM